MQLFIANGTHQVIDFQYRLPDINIKRYRQQSIPIGGQIRISGELNENQIDFIIKAHLKYGMLRANEISNFRGFYIPYIYSIDIPISAEIIAELVVQNRMYNKVKGEHLRAEAAIAVNDMIEKNANDQLTTFEMEIEEKQSKDRDPMIAEKIVVTRDKEKGAPQDPTKGPFGIVSEFKQTLRKAVF